MALTGKKQQNIDPSKVDTIIGKGTIVKGNVTASGILRIEGELEGELNSQGDIIVGETGSVKAGIKARSVTVVGQVEGNIEAQERLEIRSGGAVTGDVTVGQIFIDEGASFNGNCSMVKKNQGLVQKNN